MDRLGLTGEEAANVATAGAVALAFAWKAWRMLRLTRAWNGLGRALTALAVVMALFWAWVCLIQVWPHARHWAVVWALRAALVGSAVAVAVELGRTRLVAGGGERRDAEAARLAAENARLRAHVAALEAILDGEGRNGQVS